MKVTATTQAESVVRRVAEAGRDQLVMVLGTGCCDSTAPFLFAGYVTGPNERLVGEVEGVPVYLDQGLVASFAGTEVVVDTSDDPQPDSFSCESELGSRFYLQRMPAPSSA